MDMAGREQAVRRWFSMWLEGRDTGILQLFAPDALYIESWGPEYRGAQQKPRRYKRKKASRLLAQPQRGKHSKQPA